MLEDAEVRTRECLNEQVRKSRNSLINALVGMGAALGLGYMWGSHFGFPVKKNPSLIATTTQAVSQPNVFDLDYKIEESYSKGFEKGKIEGYAERKLDEMIEYFADQEFTRRYPYQRGALPDAEISADTRKRAAFVYGKLYDSSSQLVELVNEGKTFRNELRTLVAAKKKEN